MSFAAADWRLRLRETRQSCKSVCEEYYSVCILVRPSCTAMVHRQFVLQLFAHSA